MDNESTLTIDAFGIKRWRNKKRLLHRLDGPAVIFKDGYKEWRINGLIHREDGPAIIFPSGAKQWYFNNVSYGDNKEEYFDALPDEAKAKCLFSEDFLNG
jgi:hypothetical protein